MYFYYVDTSLGIKSVYNIMYPVYTVCLPVIIVLIVTVKMMVVLRKSRNVQNSSTSQKNKNALLNAILLTFIICQSPLLVDSIISIIHVYSHNSSLSECDSVNVYFYGIVLVLVALNSAAKPLIYMVLKNYFTWHARSLRNKGAETTEIGTIEENKPE